MHVFLIDKSGISRSAVTYNPPPPPTEAPWYVFVALVPIHFCRCMQSPPIRGAGGKRGTRLTSGPRRPALARYSHGRMHSYTFTESRIIAISVTYPFVFAANVLSQQVSSKVGVQKIVKISERGAQDANELSQGTNMHTCIHLHSTNTLQPCVVRLLHWFSFALFAEVCSQQILERGAEDANELLQGTNMHACIRIHLTNPPPPFVECFLH